MKPIITVSRGVLAALACTVALWIGNVPAQAADAPTTTPATGPTTMPTDAERKALAEAGEHVAGGRYDKAVGTLKSALKATPDSKLLRAWLVRLYRQSPEPDLDAALRLVREALSDPKLKEDADWSRMEAEVLEVRGDGAGALAALQRAVKLAPRGAEYRRELIDLLIRQKKYADAVKETHAAEEYGVKAWWLHFLRGAALARQSPPDKDAALAQFDKSIALAREEQSPDMAGQVAELVIRGIAEVVTPEAALERIGEQLRVDAALRWKLLMVSVLREKGDMAQAIKLTELFAEDPAYRATEQRVQILTTLAILHTTASTPNYERALEVYQQLLEVQPDNLTTLNNVAYMLADNFDPPRLEEARKYSRRAWDLSRKDGGYVSFIADTHGWILVLSGGKEVEEGIKVLEELTRRDPNLPEPYYHLGEGHLRKAYPDTQAAIQALQRGLAVARARRAVGGDVEPGLEDKINKAIARARRLRSA